MYMPYFTWLFTWYYLTPSVAKLLNHYGGLDFFCVFVIILSFHNIRKMLTIERKYIYTVHSRDREDLMYEVFLEKGLDVYVKKAAVEREHRPLVKHDFLYGGAF